MKRAHYIFKKREALILQCFFCGSFVLLGIVALFQKNTNGALFSFLIGPMGFMVSAGIQIDESNKRIRSYNSVLGIIFGKWLPLENFKSIVVSPVNTIHSKAGSRQSFKLFLSSVDIFKYQSLVLEESGSKERAVKRATELGQLLKLEVKVN